jgi:hypothetical protein
MKLLNFAQGAARRVVGAGRLRYHPATGTDR